MFLFFHLLEGQRGSRAEIQPRLSFLILLKVTLTCFASDATWSASFIQLCSAGNSSRNHVIRPLRSTRSTAASLQPQKSSLNVIAPEHEFMPWPIGRDLWKNICIVKISFRDKMPKVVNNCNGMLKTSWLCSRHFCSTSCGFI